MKFNPLTSAILLIITLLTTSLSAQVTIGSGQPPATGALLDLKAETDGSSKLGLGIPRVVLTKLAPTTPAELSASIGNTGNWDLTEHIGLLVYNVKEGDICDPASPSEGLHVWDGSTWVGLGTHTLAPEVYKVTDPRDGEVYLARNFGATAGDWMLENLRYVPTAADFTHTVAATPSPYTDKITLTPKGMKALTILPIILRLLGHRKIKMAYFTIGLLLLMERMLLL